jgi:hypothetical protein
VRCEARREVLKSGGLDKCEEGEIVSAKTVAFIVAALWLVLVVTIQIASADDATPDSGGGRYIFNTQTDGIVRLDTQSGQVSLCNRRAVGWVCEAAPEDRAVLENEIARLHSENALLKKDILSRGLPLPPGAMPEPPVAQSGTSILNLPTDAEVDRVVALANRVWHRLIDAVERAQKQIFNKS